jgi:ABC-type lipoprotein export system ATPase subunit
MIDTITILGGRARSGNPEGVVRIDMKMGDIVSIVGPTGSGKTTLINDIELFADANTPTGRRILFDGERPDATFRDDPSKNPIALITQHTTFLSDMPVGLFLETHAKIRCRDEALRKDVIGRTLDFANQLTGEPVSPNIRMTELSGGQTRALLIADATIVCDTPIVLLDEVENAGINRTRALELLREHRKIFIFVTHDPRIALLSDYRIVMSGGAISGVLRTDGEEKRLSHAVNRIDEIMATLREKIRAGGRITAAELGGLAS